MGIWGSSSRSSAATTPPATPAAGPTGSGPSGGVGARSLDAGVHAARRAGIRSTIDPMVSGHEAGVDHVAAQRGDVGVEQREPLVHLAFGVLARLRKDRLEQPAED